MDELSIHEKVVVVGYVKWMIQFMVLGNAHRLVKKVFNKNIQGFMIDNMIINCEIGLYCEMEEKISIVR